MRRAIGIGALLLALNGGALIAGASHARVSKANRSYLEETVYGQNGGVQVSPDFSYSYNPADYPDPNFYDPAYHHYPYYYYYPNYARGYDHDGYRLERRHHHENERYERRERHEPLELRRR